MNLKYSIQDAQGTVLVPFFTESFWDACVEARHQAKITGQAVWIVSDDLPFEVLDPNQRTH